MKKNAEQRLFGNGPCSLLTSEWTTPWGRFKNTYELLNLRALEFSPVDKISIKGTLWNSTQYILPIHWEIWFLYTIEILRGLRFKSSYVFLKCHAPSPWKLNNQIATLIFNILHVAYSHQFEKITQVFWWICLNMRCRYLYYKCACICEANISLCSLICW